jgi:hypothetical protein
MKCLPSIDFQLGDVKSVQKSRSDISNTVNIDLRNTRPVDSSNTALHSEIIFPENAKTQGSAIQSPYGSLPTSEQGSSTTALHTPFMPPRQITKAMIDNNPIFLHKLNDIQTKLLTDRDADSLANIRGNRSRTESVLDFSGCIILRGQDLADLISAMLDMPPNEVDVKYINVESDYNCCGKRVTPWTPKKQIHSIKLKDLDFQLAYNEAFNVLLSYKISLNYVLISKDEQPEIARQSRDTVILKKNASQTQRANHDVIVYG